MAIIVSDTFNRADNPASMGSADTGQPWSVVAGDFPFGILGNQAYWNRTGIGDAGIDGIVVVETGFRNLKASVRLMNVSAGGGLNLHNQGLVIRYVDATHFLMLSYFNASGTTGFRCYVADGGAASARANGAEFSMVDGDKMSFAACDQLLECYLNDVLVASTDFSLGGNGALLSPTLLAGEGCGLQASGGIISDADYQTYADFLVETNDTCPSSPSVSASPSPTPSASPSSSPSASPEPCTPPIGRAISCVNARGRLFVTLANDDSTSQVAFAWHEGAERMPITSMTNWKRSLRALTLQEMDIAFETDNLDENAPLIVSVHRNLRKNYVRDARVNSGSSRIDSLSAQFDADHIGDEIAIFGHNIGGPGIDFLIGRIAALASPSASPSPSASLSASPSATFSPSPSGSPSASPSSSRSGSPSPSHSPSSSPSASPSRSGSASPSVTASASPSASPSSSPSSSQSASPSAS